MWGFGAVSSASLGTAEPVRVDVELWTEPVFLEVEVEEGEGSKQGHQGDERAREGPPVGREA